MKPKKTDKTRQLIDLLSEIDVATIIEEKLVQIEQAESSIATLKREVELLSSFGARPAPKVEKKVAQRVNKGCFPLRDEVQAVFAEGRNDWLTTKEVATLVGYTGRTKRLYNHLQYLAGPAKQLLEINRSNGLGVKHTMFRRREQQV